LPVLASVACAAGLAVDTGDAQDGGLVYEKQLNLRLNPTPTRSGEEPGPPPPEPDAAFYEKALSLPALVTDAGGDGVQDARIIGGKPAQRGKWRSAVNFKIAYTEAGKEQASYCGGSLIDERWILTAAHCVFRPETGGLRTLKWATAYANDVRFHKGRTLRIKAVYVNRTYDAQWILNDVALLELEKATKLPRQKLAAGKGRSSFLAPGKAATIIGWGRTTPWFAPGSKWEYNSPILLEASIPIADQKTCDEFRKGTGWPKPGRPLTDADFCAGHGQAKKAVTCNGDSGGPIFVAGATGEAIQAGVTSWGWRGCPSFYAAYADVGHFEQWIRKHVPNAVFVLPQQDAPSGPLQRIAGLEPDGPPAPHGQCAVDIRVDGAAANRVRVGSRLTVLVTTGVTGHLAVFNRSPGNKRVQLFPNALGGAAHSGATPTSVRAGDVIAIPGAAGAFEVTPPDGRYEIVAIVAPEGVDLADITRPFANMAPIEDFDSVLAAIEERTRQEVESNARAARAVCTRQFDVVP
jgi:secreted trypsin-like serine protease